MCILFTLHTNLLHAKMWYIFIELHSLLHGCRVPICGTQKTPEKFVLRFSEIGHFKNVHF